MTVYDITRRACQREAFCRGCDSKIKRNEEMIYTYSMRNRGQSICFCLECAKVIGELANKEIEE
jgi:hypothetical protein